ncbi:MAG: alpha-amylase, partial [Thermoguttaceae bacterium]|nr:alpha-amylase [Thermoguttaceae bacterium]
MFLALAFHNHQPVGNFDGTIEECFQTSYCPFLELISRPEYAGLKVSIHNSGCLEEWLDRHHPEYLDQLAALARSGQVEVLGGPFQEPILAMLPSRDRVGQILTHTRWLENRLGVRVRGMWMPERVWEQSYVGDLTRAGMEFTILDDFHFKKVGLPEEKLYGYYLTEDDGQTMAVYPDSEKL